MYFMKMIYLKFLLDLEIQNNIICKFKKVDAFGSGSCVCDNADKATAYSAAALLLLRTAHGHFVQ